MKKSLTINATRNGKKVAKSFGFVNPDVANSLVGGFAQMVNALSNDTFVNAEVVKKMDTSEEDTSSQSQPAAYSLYATATDVEICSFPANQLIKVYPADINQLNEDDKEAFLNAYDALQDADDIVIQEYFWLDIPEALKSIDDVYLKFPFSHANPNIKFRADGEEMECVNNAQNSFDGFAKITRYGLCCLYLDA